MRGAVVLLALALALPGAPPLPVPRAGDDAAIEAWIAANLPGLVAEYKELHFHPELSLHEERTAGHVATALERAGFGVTRGVGGHGVVGVLANGDGPVVLLRGDMDALPVREETGLPWASRVRVEREGGEVGVMHACGHDVHVTSLVGTARLLADLRERWRGTVLAIGQPAEELGQGARMMLADGLLERFPRPDVALALHVSPDLPAGQVGITPGYWAANVDAVDVTLFGRGGHGARPHQAVDPILVSAYVITALQTLVSRRVDPVEPAVVTVGSIHGGSKHNVIPDSVHLQLTVRSYTDEVREQLLAGIRQIAVDSCRTFQCPRPPEVVVRDEFTPAAYNDPELARAAAALLGDVLGAEQVVERPPTMGGEDFGLLPRSADVPGLLFRLGSVNVERWRASRAPGAEPLPSVHSSRYFPDPEPTLRTGVRAMSNLAISLLDAPKAP